MATTSAHVDRDAHVLAKAEADPAFRQALLTDATAAIEREFGVTFSARMKVVAVEESADVHYLVLPALAANRERTAELPVNRPDGPLTDAELDGVAGGFMIPREPMPRPVKHLVKRSLQSAAQ